MPKVPARKPSYGEHLDKQRKLQPKRSDRYIKHEDSRTSKDGIVKTVYKKRWN